MLTQVLGPDCLSMCAFRLVKTDETLVASLPLRYDGALPYRRMPIQLCFYFSWFDAKTPYFDLRIHPAQIASSQAITCNMQLAWHPHGLKIPVLIENINLSVRNRRANWNKIVALE